MKFALKITLFAFLAALVVRAQDPSKPQLRPGISVQMAAAPHATATPDADKESALVVVVTDTGKLCIGTKPATTADLEHLKAGTVYFKADARATYQTVINALDALHGHTILLLTQAPIRAGEISQPYALSLSSTAP